MKALRGKASTGKITQIKERMRYMADRRKTYSSGRFIVLSLPIHNDALKFRLFFMN